MAPRSDPNEIPLAACYRELTALQQAIPVYASWRFEELRRVAYRYFELLANSAAMELYAGRCKELLRSQATILLHVGQAMFTGDWRPFNRAAFILQWDLDELKRILGCKAP